MRSRSLHAFLGSALVLFAIALAARGAAPVAATPLPALATPRSAHLALDLTIGGGATTGESFTISARGEGDIDTARRAMQFTYTLRLPTELGGTAPASAPLTAELIMVDGRIYLRDPATKQWTWLAAPDGSANEALFAPNFADFGGTPPDFARVGPELLNGAATTRWHASYDLADLLPAEPSTTTLPEMTLEIDYWIGDADRYVRRVALGMAFAVPATDESGGNFSLTMALTYSNFDQPVQIVAPAGATPAAAGNGAGLTDAGLLVASALPFDTSTFPLPGVGGGIAGIFPGLGGATGGAGNATIGSGGTPIGRSGGANPTPTARRSTGSIGGARIGATDPTATAQAAPAPTRAVSPTALAPTATRPATAPPASVPTAAIVVNAALPPTVAPPAQGLAPTTAQEPPRAPAARGSTLPLALGAAGLILLLGLSGGLIVAGRRTQGR